MSDVGTTLDSRRPAPDAPAASYDHSWLATHLAEERRESALLGEIREIVFGAQDGLVSTLAVVATVAGATYQAFPVVIAGIASGLAGVFSMAAGEYVGSKSQREIFEAQIANERVEVEERPGESEAEVAFMLADEGLGDDEAARVAAILPSSRLTIVRSRTSGCCARIVSRELGI